MLENTYAKPTLWDGRCWLLEKGVPRHALLAPWQGVFQGTDSHKWNAMQNRRQGVLGRISWEVLSGGAKHITKRVETSITVVIALKWIGPILHLWVRDNLTTFKNWELMIYHLCSFYKKRYVCILLLMLSIKMEKHNITIFNIEHVCVCSFPLRNRSSQSSLPLEFTLAA